MKQSDIQVTAIHPKRWGDDLDVVNAARVSFAKESDWVYETKILTQHDADLAKAFNGTDYKISDIGKEYKTGKHFLSQQDEKLIRYLAKHQHKSPFNHSFITMRIKAPVFVARQLVKHRFMPWNEVSRRYVDDEPEFYFPEYWRKKADNVKQGSSEEVFKHGPYIRWNGSENTPQQMMISALATYEQLLEKGVCAEQARMVLPQNMMSEWIWSGTLGAWCDMLKLRMDPHTQYESRIVANKAYELIKPVFPVSVGALLD